MRLKLTHVYIKCVIHAWRNDPLRFTGFICEKGETAHVFLVDLSTSMKIAKQFVSYC